MKRRVNALKYYNIFSWLYLKYFRNKNVSLGAVQVHAIRCAESEGHSASWWDFFDGICWICFAVFCLMAILPLIASVLV